MLWDLGSGRRLKTMTGHTGFIYSLNFSADSNVLVSGGADCTVRVWDVNKDTPLEAGGMIDVKRIRLDGSSERQQHHKSSKEKKDRLKEEERRRKGGVIERYGYMEQIIGLVSANNLLLPTVTTNWAYFLPSTHQYTRCSLQDVIFVSLPARFHHLKRNFDSVIIKRTLLCRHSASSPFKVTPKGKIITFVSWFSMHDRSLLLFRNLVTGS